MQLVLPNWVGVNDISNALASRYTCVAEIIVFNEFVSETLLKFWHGPQ